MGAHVDITYQDGRKETVAVLPIAALFAERKFGKDVPPVEGTLYGVWCLLRKPGENFDAWVESLADWREYQNGAAAPLAEGPPPAQ